MRSVSVLCALVFSAIKLAKAQNIGTQMAETHPPLTVSTCTASGCTTEALSIVLDSNWRWTHQTNSTTNCFNGNTWDATLCPSPATRTANCAIDGASYQSTYGITTSGNALTINFVTQNSNGANIGSRVYLLQNTNTYVKLNLLNMEFSFTVDVSTLPCGLNGALYFVEMDADGGLSKFTTNKAGAAYGTGYCDSQCPRAIKWINGMANSGGWVADANNKNTGIGQFGTCCAEMDIWEANSDDFAVTPHPCSVTGQVQCSGAQCGCGGTEVCSSTNRYTGVCDPDGCDFNPYRWGVTNFYGSGMTIDTTKTFQVITQFITSDGTSSGTLTQINRLFVQGGVIHNLPFPTYSAISQYNFISEAMCDAAKALTGDNTSFESQGGLAAMGQALGRGVVLVMSLWDDYAVDMLWLDSDYPTNVPTTNPGVARGRCAITSGVPATVEAQSPSAHVIYSDIRWGPIGSTFSGTSATSASTSTTVTTPTVATSTTTTTTTTTSSAATGCVVQTSTTTTTTTTTRPTTTTTTTTTHTTTTSAAGCQTKYGQCGGIPWSGPTCCVSGSTCSGVSAPYYYQCL